MRCIRRQTARQVDGDDRNLGRVHVGDDGLHHPGNSGLEPCAEDRVDDQRALRDLREVQLPALFVRNLYNGHTQPPEDIEVRPRVTADVGERATPRRGYRRVEWIERALEPLRDRLPAERFERLVSALTLVVGWEAMIVLEDTRGLDHRAAEEICVWAARTLLAAETA